VPVTGNHIDTVDEGIDDSPCTGIRGRSVLERTDADREAVFVNVDLELERIGTRVRSDGRSGERELVDPVDGKIEPRAQAAEHERHDSCAAGVGGHLEENRVHHEPAARDADPSTLTAVPEPDLTLSTETTDGVRITHVVGELDLSTVDAFDAELNGSFSAGRQIVDLTECTFVDSSALRAFARAQRRISEAGGSFALVAPSQPARRTLEVAALDRFVAVFESVDEAVASFG
jgi:anti-sigma B factor antagonist